jgi:hypothetical protein
MTTFKVPDGTLEQVAAGKAKLTIPAITGLLADPGAIREATHVYSLGDRVKDTATVVGEAGVAVFECVVAGTTAGSNPFGVYPGYFPDGTAVWLYIGYIGGIDCRLAASPVAYAHDGVAEAGPLAYTDGAGDANATARALALGTGTALAGLQAGATSGKTAYVEVEATSAGASLAIHDGTHVGDAGQVLTSDGTHAAWAAAAGAGGTERPLVDPTGLSWSWVNQGTATITTQGASLLLYHPAVNADDMHYRAKAVPSKPYSVIVHWKPACFALNYAGVAVGWMASDDHTATYLEIWVNAYRIGASISGTPYNMGTSDYMSQNAPSWPWVKLTDDSTNRRIYVSRDGYTWLLLHSIATDTDVTPTRLVFGVSSRNNAGFEAALMIDSWEEA